MSSYKIALVGRPNVGKSALFNRISKKRIAIVDEEVGVTRDRLYAQTDLFGKPFEVIDTGGIDSQGQIAFYEEVRRQTEIAIEEADSLIMVVDSRVGITDLDEEVTKILQKTGKPITLAVNKIDDVSHEERVHEFYGLGIEKMVPVSATQGYQIAELLEEALRNYRPSLEEDDGSIKVALIGRPNVGKSTLLNTLLNEERSVVSPIAGTTRDAIDTKILFEDQLFTLIDTAGIRRKHAEHDVVDKFAAIRTERAIDRADVCLLLADSQEGLTTQEKRIATMIEEKGKGVVVIFNKWDLVKGFRMEHCAKALRDEASFLSTSPLMFISAHTGRNVKEIFEKTRLVYKNQNSRISTGQLNQFVEKAMQRVHPPMIRGKRLRIYYMTQIQTAPPKFVLFVNHPDLMQESYKRYLINQFREVYGFEGCPIYFSLKGKNRDKKLAKQL